MQVTATPVLRDIVLIGGGHSHVGVLYMFAMKPVPGVRLTVICTDTDTPYSGMLPGYIAGHYSFDDVHIDLRRLAEFAGARFYRDEVIGIDRGDAQGALPQSPARALRCAVDQHRLHAAPRRRRRRREHAVPVKPISRFNERWLALLERVCRHAGTTTHRRGRRRRRRRRADCWPCSTGCARNCVALGRNPDELRCHLFSAEAQILPTHNAAVRRAFERVLAERGVVVHRDAEVTQVLGRAAADASGEVLDADEIVWVTQAGGAAWLRDTGLALDDEGFIRVRDTLQSETDPLVFAAGDCAAMIDHPLEKAGVFAVRMGQPLAENLRRTVTRQPLVDYRPQRRWLALISTGDRHAVASRGAFCARGDLVWRWKDWIDRRFMRKFSEFAAMSEAMAAAG